MLKRMLASTAALALFALPISAQSSMGGMNMGASGDVTLTGTVVDVSCNSTLGASGASHKACAQACAKAGEPLAIMADGVIYIPVSNKPGDPQNPRLIDLAEGKVKVTGTVKEAHGLHTIQIKTIEAAS